MRSMVASSMWPQPPPAAMTQAWPWRSAEVEDELELDGAHVARVCLKCFRCFGRMLQVFHVHVAKLDLDVCDVAYVLRVASVFHLHERFECSMQHETYIVVGFSSSSTDG